MIVTSHAVRDAVHEGQTRWRRSGAAYATTGHAGRVGIPESVAQERICVWDRGSTGKCHEHGVFSRGSSLPTVPEDGIAVRWTRAYITALQRDSVVLVEDDLIGLSPKERKNGRENFGT